MPVTTKKTLRGLGKERKLTSLQFTKVYRKASELAIQKAYTMVRTRRRLEKDPSWRPPNVRRKEKNGWEQTELLGTSGMLAMRDAKRKHKELQREQARSWRPPAAPPSRRSTSRWAPGNRTLSHHHLKDGSTPVVGVYY